MCLAIPVRIIELLDDGMAVSDVGGVRRTISLALVEDVKVGDYVISHVDHALSRLDPEEAQKTLELFAQVGIAYADGKGTA